MSARTPAASLESNLWELHLSTPLERVDADTGEVTWTRKPSYVNRRIHVIAPTLERSIEIAKEGLHPEARLHQVIRRNDMGSVLVDAAVVDAVAY